MSGDLHFFRLTHQVMKLNLSKVVIQRDHAARAATAIGSYRHASPKRQKQLWVFRRTRCL